MEQAEKHAETNAGLPTPSGDKAAEVPVRLTPKAVNMVKITREQEGLDPACGLRIAVRGGGCSGFEYALDFELEPRDTDLVYQQGDLKVLIDPISARYLKGTEIDYVLGTTGAGFKFNNPQAVGTCGCGSSFSV
ncbi:MAG: iron-sulfur cluster assembly accessory protein [Acidobacteria bacterium]|nr:MAG: iron-sulfur cluster assembly accessory protein [Acidobacteriota bacterium]